QLTFGIVGLSNGLRSTGPTLPTANSETGFTVQPIQPLPVHDVALASNQDMQPPIAIAALLSGQGREPFAQLCVALGTSRFVPKCCPRDASRPTGAGHPHRTLGHQHLDRFAPGLWAQNFRPSKSFSAALSNSASASNFLSRAFSVSSSFRRLASETGIPP